MPILSVPIEETSTTVEVAPTKGSDFDKIFPEAVIFGLALVAIYVVFRLVISLLPILLTVGGLGIALYLGYKIL